MRAPVVLVLRRWSGFTAMALVAVLTVVMLGWGAALVRIPLSDVTGPLWVYLPAFVAVVAGAVLAGAPSDAERATSRGGSVSGALRLATAAACYLPVTAVVLIRGLPAQVLVSLLAYLVLMLVAVLVLDGYYWVPVLAAAVIVVYVTSARPEQQDLWLRLSAPAPIAALVALGALACLAFARPLSRGRG